MIALARATQWLAILLLANVPAWRADARVKLDPAQVEAWMDKVYQPAIREKHAVGVVVGIVQDGRVVLMKGYGYADRTAVVPMNAQTTPVRSGSASKVMTAISIMQLVEAGRISLDGNINDYLTRVKVPQPMGPVTVRHLLTHSSGFGDRWRDNLRADPVQERATAAEIRRYMPVQERRPGLFSAYANFNFALLGTIVEDVSGLTYREYVTRHILQPLGMRNSFVEVKGHLPLDRIAREQSIEPDGAIVQRPFYYKSPFYLGSGGLFWTAADMGRFMTALIDGANGRPNPLLLPVGFREMYRPQFSNTGIHSIGLAFAMEARLPAEAPRIDSMIGHSGATGSFRGYMTTLPKEGVGIFIGHIGICSWPTAIANLLPQGCKDLVSSRQVQRNFITAFFGPEPTPARVNTPVETARFVGDYVDIRVPLSRDAILAWIDDRRIGLNLAVRQGAGGTLEMKDNSGALSGTYVPVSQTEFADNAGNRLRFVHDKATGTDYLLFGTSRAAARVAWWDSPKLLLSALGLLLGTAALFVAAPGRGLHSRRALWAARGALALAIMTGLFPLFDAVVLQHYYRLAETSYLAWSVLAYGFAAAAAGFLVAMTLAAVTGELKQSSRVRAMTLALILAMLAFVMTRLGLFALDG
jgi:CubicO group peptidase (beta-lactamase class C family)